MNDIRLYINSWWNFINADNITLFGGYTFSFMDIFLFSAVVGIVGYFVFEMMDR